jgi:hypothetical protein
MVTSWSGRTRFAPPCSEICHTSCLLHATRGICHKRHPRKAPDSKLPLILQVATATRGIRLTTPKKQPIERNNTMKPTNHTTMKTKHALCGLLSGLLMLAAGTAQVHAASMFVENFNSNSLGPNFYLAEGNLITSGGNVGLTWSPSSYGGVNTVGTDYHLTNFIAQITVNVTPEFGTQQLFFGLGRGLTTPDPGDNFGNPASGPMVFLRHIQGFGGNPINNLTLATNDENNGGLSPGGGMGEILNQSGVGPGYSTYTLQMEHIAGLVQFSVNNVAYGPAVDVSSYDFTGQGHIFFGGYADTAGSVTFDNFSVSAIPEPTSALLLLGSGAMLLNRRRRASA